MSECGQKVVLYIPATELETLWIWMEVTSVVGEGLLGSVKCATAG